MFQIAYSIRPPKIPNDLRLQSYITVYRNANLTGFITFIFIPTLTSNVQWPRLITAIRGPYKKQGYIKSKQYIKLMHYTVHWFVL